MERAVPPGRPPPGPQTILKLVSSIDVPRQALPFTLAGGPRNHRRPLVGTPFLRAPGAGKRGRQWSAIAPLFAAAPYTRGSPPRIAAIVAIISAYSAMVWPRPNSRPRTMSRYGPLLIAGDVFHFSGAEIYSRPSPELPSGPLESAEYKGRRKFRSSPARATMRPRAKMFFGGALAQWPARAPFCSEKSTRISPSSCPSDTHAPQKTFS